MSDFACRVLAWFDEHGRRDLPWQQDVTPYRVWVSEIMLQQTQVATVIPYFNRFVERFPDVSALAAARQDEVLARWSGLGYYARARNLHKAAQVVHGKFGGTFPASLDAVMTLPGIGRSTAGAILSLAFAQRHAILDGNVKRVLARHAAIAGWPGTGRVADELWRVAEQHTPQKRVAEYTQAMMDLGATLCTRSKPSCERCPVADDCESLLMNKVGDYPGRKPKSAKPLRTTTMILASANGQVYLERRPETGIWGGLWSLPELDERSVGEWCEDVLDSAATRTQPWDILRHSFSHYDLDIQPIVVHLDSRAAHVADAGARVWYKLDDEPPGGLAAPVKKLINQLRNRNNATHC
ncbi:MAG: A/G-specific adenine glycosylase [Gammaproteobacteria bacterium]|nr:A/G-specific adenine glycosylase [Gammaproteobacteria bacterium]